MRIPHLPISAAIRAAVTSAMPAFALSLSLTVLAGVAAPMPAAYGATARGAERELSQLYKDSLSDSLGQLFPDRRFGVFVDVTVTDPASLKTLPEQPDFMPGTITPSLEIWKRRYGEALESLPQKRKFLVVIPPESDEALVAAVKNATARVMHLQPNGDELAVEKAFGKPEAPQVQEQKEETETTETTSGDPKQPERKPAEAPPAPKSDDGSSWMWMVGVGVLLLALAFVAAVIISRLKGAKSPLQKIMNMTKGLRGKGKKKPAEKEKPKGAEAPPAGTPDSVVPIWPPAGFTIASAVEQVEKVAAGYPDVASQALVALAARPELSESLAAGIQVLGPSKAIDLFPYVSQGAWTQIGVAVAARPVTASNPASLDEVLYFVQMLASEMFRIQGERKTPRLMPELEKKSPQELIQTVGARDPKSMATLLAVLPSHLGSALLGNVPAQEWPELFKRLAGINSLSANEVGRLQQGLMSASAEDRMYPVDTIPKVVEILSALGPADELQMFSKLASKDPSMLAKVAPARLYPEHLAYIPPETLTPFVQDLGLDEITSMAFAVDTQIANSILALLSEKQRGIVQESLQDGAAGADVEAGQATLRNFLDQVQKSLFKNNSANVQKMFGRGGNSQAA